MEIKSPIPLVGNQSLIDEIEEIKKILTLTQRAIEDGKGGVEPKGGVNWQEAGDTSCMAKLRLNEVTETIVELFNKQAHG